MFSITPGKYLHDCLHDNLRHRMHQIALFLAPLLTDLAHSAMLIIGQLPHHASRFGEYNTVMVSHTYNKS